MNQPISKTINQDEIQSNIFLQNKPHYLQISLTRLIGSPRIRVLISLTIRLTMLRELKMRLQKIARLRDCHMKNKIEARK